MATQYGASNYDEWKKLWGVNDAVRTNGMTDADYYMGLSLKDKAEQNKALEDIYRGVEQTAKKNYENTAGAIEGIYRNNVGVLNDNRKTAQQNADILHRKMGKYLKTQAEAAGLSGTGYASDGSLQLRANAAYNENLGAIDKNYNESKTALDNQRSADMAAAASTRDNAVANAGMSLASARANLNAQKNAEMMGIYKEEAARLREDEQIRYAREQAEDEKAWVRGNYATEQDKAEAQNRYTKIREAIGNGNLSQGDFNEMLLQSGLDANDAATLTAIYNAKAQEYGQATSDETYNTILSQMQAAGNANEAEALLSYYPGLSDEQKFRLQTYVDSRRAAERVNIVSTQLENGGFDNTQEFKEALDSSGIDKGSYEYQLLSAYGAGYFATRNNEQQAQEYNALAKLITADGMTSSAAQALLDKSNLKGSGRDQLQAVIDLIRGNEEETAQLTANAEAAAEEQKTAQQQAEAAASMEAELAYAADRDTALKTLEAYRDRISENTYNSWARIIDSTFPEQKEYKRYDDTPGGNKYIGEITQKNFEKLQPKIERELAYRLGYNEELKDGTTIDIDGKTIEYFDGSWHEVIEQTGETSGTGEKTGASETAGTAATAGAATGAKLALGEIDAETAGKNMKFEDSQGRQYALGEKLDTSDPEQRRLATLALGNSRIKDGEVQFINGYHVTHINGNVYLLEPKKAGNGQGGASATIQKLPIATKEFITKE